MTEFFLYIIFILFSLSLLTCSQNTTCDNKEIIEITEEKDSDLNKTSNYSLEYLKEQYKTINKQSIDHFLYSRELEQSWCYTTENNLNKFNIIIKSLKELLIPIDNGEIRLKENEVKEFFNLRGDIAFCIRNVERMISVIKIKKIHCKDFEREQEEIMNKNIKKLEEIMGDDEENGHEKQK